MAESDLGKSEVFWTLFVVQAAWEAWPRRQSRWRGEGAPGGEGKRGGGEEGEAIIKSSVITRALPHTFQSC